MPTVNSYLANPQWIRQEITSLNKYIDQFNAEVREI